MNLRSWLRKAPTPHSLRLVCADGPQDVAINHADARKWARAAETVQSLSPTRIDALDPKGKVLRSAPFASGDEPETEEEKPEAPRSKLAELAKHLNAAADNAAKHVRESSKESMDAMVRVMDVAVRSFEKISTAMDRLSRRLEAAQSAVNAGEGDAEDVPSILLSGLIARQMGPGAAAMLARQRPGAPAPASGGGLPGIPDDLTPEEEAELGQLAGGFMARYAAKRASPPAPPAKPNGKSK